MDLDKKFQPNRMQISFTADLLAQCQESQPIEIKHIFITVYLYHSLLSVCQNIFLLTHGYADMAD